MKKLIVASVVCFFVVSASAVSGETASPRKLNYVSVGAGYVGDWLLGDVLSSEIKFPERPDRTPLPGVDLSTGYMAGIRCGRLIRPPYAQDIRVELAAELEGFMVGGTDVDHEYYGLHPFGTTITADMNISIQTMMLNFLLRYPYGSVHPYGGIGIGWAWFECDTVLIMEPGYDWDVNDPDVNETNDLGKLDDDTFAGQFRLGCELDVTDTWSFDLGYRYFRIDHAELKSPDFDLHLQYEVDMVTVGLIYRF